MHIFKKIIHLISKNKKPKKNSDDLNNSKFSLSLEPLDPKAKSFAKTTHEQVIPPVLIVEVEINQDDDLEVYLDDLKELEDNIRHLQLKSKQDPNTKITHLPPSDRLH